MIQPIHMRVHNFGLIKESSTKIPTNDFTYISGEYHNDVGISSNAAGKSTSINALWWGLSGDAIQKRMKDFNAADIIGPWDTHAEVEVQLADPDHKYLVIRRRVKSALVLAFYIDGEKVSGKNPTATEEMIRDTLGVDWDVFRYSNYIPQEDAKTGFLYATDNERKKLIAKLYKQDFFEKALTKVKEFLKAKRAKGRECEREIDRIAGEISASEDNSRSVAEQLNAAKVKNLMAERAFRADNAEQLEEYEQSLQEVTKIVISREQEIRSLQETITLLSGEKRELSGLLENLKAKDYALEVEMKNYLALLEPLTQTVKTLGDCPTCLRPIDEKALKPLKLERRRLIRRYSNAEEQQQEGAGKIDTILADVRDVAVRLGGCADKRETIQQSLPQQRKQQTICEQKIEKLQDKELNLIDTSPLEQLQKDLKASLKTLHTTSMEKTVEVDDLLIDIGRLEVWEHAYAHAMKSMAFESVIDRFTDLVNAKLLQIYSGNLSIKFDTKLTKGDDTKDKFTVLIRDKDLRTWKGASMASGGQKRIISLAIALGMMELSNPQLGLFLADEALEGVDTTSYKAAMSCIRGLAGTVLNVSHSNPPAGERHIVVTRKRGEISFGV